VTDVLAEVPFPYFESALAGAYDPAKNVYFIYLENLEVKHAVAVVGWGGAFAHSKNILPSLACFCCCWWSTLSHLQLTTALLIIAHTASSSCPCGFRHVQVGECVQRHVA